MAGAPHPAAAEMQPPGLGHQAEMPDRGLVPHRSLLASPIVGPPEPSVDDAKGVAALAHTVSLALAGRLEPTASGRQGGWRCRDRTGAEEVVLVACMDCKQEMTEAESCTVDAIVLNGHRYPVSGFAAPSAPTGGAAIAESRGDITTSAATSSRAHVAAAS